MFKSYMPMVAKVEAVQFTMENKDQVFNSIAGNCYADFEQGNPILCLYSAEKSNIFATLGDWIVKEKEIGTYKIVSDEDFKERYQIVYPQPSSKEKNESMESL